MVDWQVRELLTAINRIEYGYGPGFVDALQNLFRVARRVRRQRGGVRP